MLDQVRLKEEAWIRHRRNGKSNRLKQIYIKARNDTTKVVRKAKYDFEHRLAEEIRFDQRAFYAYARSRTTIKEQVLAVRKDNGEMTETIAETCEVMNRQFQKVFSKTDGIKPPPARQFEGQV